jgi:hypothetical protein
MEKFSARMAFRAPSWHRYSDSIEQGDPMFFHNDEGKSASKRLPERNTRGCAQALSIAVNYLKENSTLTQRTRKHRFCGLLVCVVLLFSLYAGAADKGLAATPPMGWNSWNHFGCSGLNETVIKQTAAAMVSSGMKAAGYRYVNLDDCWMAARRDLNGNLVPDPTRFPSGMLALASYIHSLGLRIGLYEDVGTATCQERPGSYGHYQQDADTFASWGIDYIKMDWCNNTGLDPKTQYTQFGHALASAKGNIVLSICDWGTKQPWTWAPKVGNTWRTTPDKHSGCDQRLCRVGRTGCMERSGYARGWQWRHDRYRVPIALLHVGHVGRATYCR